MREFLHGWRRTVGVVSLVAACGLTSAWLRSKDIQEVLCFRLAYQGQVLHSASGSLYWWTVPASQIKPSGWPQWHRSLPDNLTYDGIIIRPQLIQGSIPKYDYYWPSTYHRQPIRAMALPYWKLAIPLTVLSAYLLLWKPRKPHP